VLQCVACSVLQYVAVCCSVLKCVEVCCSVSVSDKICLIGYSDCDIRCLPSDYFMLVDLDTIFPWPNLKFHILRS